MSFKLDHVIIHVANLEAGMARAREQGFRTFFGGVHASGTTHNALICFADGTYEELLALTGDPPRCAAAPTADFGVLIRGKPEGVVGWAIGTTDLDADTALLRAHGIPVGELTPGQRQRSDGELLQWRLAWLTAMLPVFLIQDVTPRPLRVPGDEVTVTHANGTRGIEALVLPPTLDEVTLFPALFGIPQAQADGDKTYLLNGVKLIISPSVTTPEVRVRRG